MLRLYQFDNKQHHAPHIHAEHQGDKAVYLLETGERIAGTMPINKERLIQAWLLIHKEDLLIDWELALNGEVPFRIDPLR
ncbi:MAG: DUF4160 domain-containing protein [Gallionella sp.]